MTEKNFLEYRPSKISEKRPNTVIENISKSIDNEEPLLLKEFKSYSPSTTLTYAKQQLDDLSEMINDFKEQMNKEDVDEFEKAIKEHDISTIFNKRKELSEDINNTTIAEFFPFIYKIKDDLEKNIKSFMLETFGKEVNLTEAKNKSDAILNQISKNISNINIDAIYMDTLYNFCLMNKADIIKEFIFNIEFLKNEVYLKQYKSKEMDEVINESFKQLNIKNDKDAKKLEQFIFSSIYPSLNNIIVTSKEKVLNNLNVYEEADKFSNAIKFSLNKTLSISNNMFLNAIEDFLKANKTLEILLNDYKNSLLNKHELRKI